MDILLLLETRMDLCISAIKMCLSEKKNVTKEIEKNV